LASGDGTEIPLGFPTAAEAAKVSPTRPAWAPQDHLEPLLHAVLRTLPKADVRFRCEVVGLGQDDDGVHAVLRERESGRTQPLDALFVIAADGAHSTVRNHLGIRMEGRDDLAEYHRVEFRAPLAEVAGERRYGLYVITRPDAAGVLAPRGPDDRWAFSWERSPGQPRYVDYRDEQLLELIGLAAGVPRLEPRIERQSVFSFAAQIAERYREGRGFLVGDAAHRMTPRGGTGMNTAIQDAYDLGWKLAWVLQGWADVDLLASYETDRRPVGLHNVHRASDPDGARRDAEEALPWDLNGRLDHHWIRQGNGTLSTLDLVGEGLTLLAGPGDSRWAAAGTTLGHRAPLVAHTLDADTAHALGLEPGGAILVRPDGRPVRVWPNFTAFLDSGPLTGV
ncbi:MAG TPA: FAD-dependent monooxygenase, partial [Acidimicrobiia bacterium]|nr:FAD-dependent monooxygenase [Acidimicrobiia bacterium]